MQKRSTGNDFDFIGDIQFDLQDMMKSYPNLPELNLK